MDCKLHVPDPGEVYKQEIQLSFFFEFPNLELFFLSL